MTEGHSNIDNIIFGMNNPWNMPPSIMIDGWITIKNGIKYHHRLATDIEREIDNKKHSYMEEWAKLIRHIITNKL